MSERHWWLLLAEELFEQVDAQKIIDFSKYIKKITIVCSFFVFCPFPSKIDSKLLPFMLLLLFMCKKNALLTKVVRWF